MRTMTCRAAALAAALSTLIFCALARPSRASDPVTPPALPKAIATRPVKLPAKLRTPVEEGQVHLNTATRMELLRLPGVGPATVEAMLAYRGDHKGFVDITELQNVRGIGARKFNRIAPFVRL